MAKALFALNPALDRAALAERFASRRRVQVRDVLTPETAREVRTVLERGTAWGLAIEGRETGGPQALHAPELRTKEGQARAQSLYRAAHEGAAAGDYAFRYGRYSLVEAAVGGWDPGGAHEILLEHFNTRAFLDLVQDITGFGDLAKADGHATLFAREQFLGLHIDSHVAEGWRVAYVLNVADEDWKPDWGGYLAFYDEEGDIVEAWRPRFNTLNLFAVPQPHAVTYVAPFAPAGRFAISGWVRDR